MGTSIRNIFYVLVTLLTLESATPVAAKPQVVAPPSLNGTLVKLAKQVEPDLQGRPERLPLYVDYFRSKLANDTRLFAFEVKPHVEASGKVSLQGFVEFSQTRDGLIEFLQVLGFEVSDEQLKTMPDADLGKQRYGLVKSTHTLSYSSPNKPRSVVTDCLLGEPLYLLREQDGHFLVHSGEGYLGYVAASDVYRVSAKKFDLFPTSRAVRILETHTMDNGFVIPAGALLKRLPGEGENFVCALPTGEVVELPPEKCEPSDPPTDAIERAIEVGKRMLGTPYHWGGKTSSGVDCSGLVQVAFSTCGVHLPRDSNQQFLLGQLTATRWHRSGLRRGDTLYFLGTNGRIRHTALYLGGDRFLQAEMPAANIRSLNPEHDDYDERRDKSFAFGKRLWQ